ncbi:hypothetical protein F5Y15DRAFT_365262 [Xylariaceae sp. FL0016]|nr:hypothetical protein F5Y15DRAFT_365262 [Xylariaceae sp. FL0016]
MCTTLGWLARVALQFGGCFMFGSRCQDGLVTQVIVGPKQAFGNSCLSFAGKAHRENQTLSQKTAFPVCTLPPMCYLVCHSPTGKYKQSLLRGIHSSRSLSSRLRLATRGVASARPCRASWDRVFVWLARRHAVDQPDHIAYGRQNTDERAFRVSAGTERPPRALFRTRPSPR